MKFYGIAPELVTGFPYRLSLLAAGIGIFSLKNRKAARYLVAAFLTVGLFIFPYTGWIFGMAFTPNQLWRVTWLMPFGISIAFLVHVGLETLYNHLVWLPKHNRSLQNISILCCQMILLLGTFYLIPWAEGNLGFGPMKPGSVRWYQEYIEMGQVMQEKVPPQAVIIGGPKRTTNDMIPSLSLDVQLVSFRNERGGRTAPIWEAMVSEDTPLDERMALFEKYNVSYLLLRGKVSWMEDLVTKAPNRIESLHQNRKLQLYQILPP
jgi:hypothetical protein